MLAKLSSSIKENISNKTNWLSFIAGLSVVFAYAPFSQWWLALVVPAIWLKQIQNKTVKFATKQGFIFGFGWFCSGISWVHVSIDQFGGMPLFFSLLLMLLLCCYLALFPALACYLTTKLSPQKKFNLWLFPSFWLLSEYFRAVALTGFPWLSLGYSQIDGPLASFAPVIGEIGITLLVLMINISIVHIANRYYVKSHLSLLTVIALACLCLSQISWVEPSNKTIKAALVQGNIPQEMKWQPEEEWPSMLKYLDLTRVNYDADIIIWPESAVPAVEARAQDFLALANKSATINNSAIITGIINYNFESREFFNSLIVLGKKHEQDSEGNYYYNHSNRYYKNHLLPIGEFVPFQEWLRPIAPLFNLPMSSFSRGDYVQRNLIAKDLVILPLICFEIAFPGQLASNITQDTNLLLTVSNDAWFGDSHGPHQHLDIARMRALEFGRPLLRSTNNGITAIVDHKGNISAKIPQFTEAVLKADVQLVTGTTPYTKYWQFVYWLLPLLTLNSYFIPLIVRKKSATKS